MTDRVLVSPTELFGDGVFETVHLRPSGPWLLGVPRPRTPWTPGLLELLGYPPMRSSRADM